VRARGPRPPFTLANLEANLARHPRSTVSVPFSMGTVLHRTTYGSDAEENARVSVPFSMGTVLHQR